MCLLSSNPIITEALCTDDYPERCFRLREDQGNLNSFQHVFNMQ